MHKIIENGNKLIRPFLDLRSITTPTQCRHISRNTAIAQGIREGFGAQKGGRRLGVERRRVVNGLDSDRRSTRSIEPKKEQSWEKWGFIPHEEEDWSTPLGFSSGDSTTGTDRNAETKVKIRHDVPKFRMGDWICEKNNCNYHNYAKNEQCFRCGTPCGPPYPNAIRTINATTSIEREKEKEKEKEYKMPLAIPYTTAASEFLYGHSAVYAALQAKRRKLYTLYLHRRAARLNSTPSLETDIQNLANEAKINVRHVGDDWLPILDKMSGDRPHNGCVLEASALPRPPVIALGKVLYGSPLNPEKPRFTIEVAAQSQDDLNINGNPTEILSKADHFRRPFVLLIDDVLDPGNLGAIIRSAYFLGVDAIALSSRTCAPITPVALKASAGAAEALPILSIDDPAEFLRRSSAKGWKVYCGTAPNYAATHGTPSSDSTPTKDTKSWAEPHTEYTLRRDGTLIDPDFSPIRFAPTILVVGGEGKGLRSNLTQSAYAFVEIRPQINIGDFGVDSLNVSVATALLCADIIRPRPLTVKLPPKALRSKDSIETPPSGHFSPYAFED